MPRRRARCRSVGRTARRRRRRSRRAHPDVALRARVRAGRPQTLNRIDDERKRLVFDVDRLDGLGRDGFADGRDREDRLALIQRLVRQPALALRGRLNVLSKRRACRRLREIIFRDNRLDARHRERFARVELRHLRVRVRARQKLAEQHALDAPVFGVACRAGDLRDEIGSGVNLADEFGGCHGVNLSSALHRASSR